MTSEDRDALEIDEDPVELRSRIYDGRPSVVHIWRALLGFSFRDGCFWGMPQVSFRPNGLVIWGAPDGAVLEQAVIGNRLEVLASVEGVPVKFFAMGESYAQIAKLLDEGKEPPAWCTWHVITPGTNLRIMIQSKKGKTLGPEDGIELCMWGRALHS